MAHQTQVKQPYPNGRSSHGASPTPVPDLARSSAEFLHDITTLAELQTKLIQLEARQAGRQLRMPVAGFIAGLTLAIGCVPIALAALGLALAEYTQLTYAASFGIVVLIGLALSGVTLFVSYRLWRKGVHVFERSQSEWQRNVQWFKETLKRFSQRAGSSRAYGDDRALF